MNDKTKTGIAVAVGTIAYISVFILCPTAEVTVKIAYSFLTAIVISAVAAFLLSKEKP